MKTNIKFTNMKSSDKLRDYAESKYESFSKLVAPEHLEDAVCNVELAHDAHHQNGDVCMTEVTLDVNGKVYRATKFEKKMEKAIDKVKDDILEALRTDKGKREDSKRKGAAQAKEMLRSE